MILEIESWNLTTEAVNDEEQQWIITIEERSL